MNHVLYDFETAKSNKHLLDIKENTSASSSFEVLFGNRDNVGFFYFRPSEFHFRCCLSNLKNYLPRDNFLVAFLIQKLEMPWVKLFPLRLFLKLGDEFNSNIIRFKLRTKNNSCFAVLLLVKSTLWKILIIFNFKAYPCSLISDRSRAPVFGEIGQTILSLLCDVRNFQYTIAQIDGLSIRLEENASLLKIIIPESQYDLIIKSLLTSNEYVFSLAKLNMDEACSSHLVAIENKNLGTYSNKTMRFAANSELENDKGILKHKLYKGF